MKKEVTKVTAAVISLLLAVGVMTVFKACGPKEDGSFMHCHYVQLYVFFISLAMAAASVLSILIKKKTVQLVLCSLNAVAALITMLLPGTIMKMCMMKEMRCYTYMQPFVRICAVLILLCSIVTIVMQMINAKKD